MFHRVGYNRPDGTSGRLNPAELDGGAALSGLASPASLTGRPVLVLNGADDLAEQGGELVLLVLAQTGADQRLARVERGEQALDDVAALGFQRDEHQPAVLIVPAAPGQAPLLQRLQYAGQRALGHSGLGRQVQI